MSILLETDYGWIVSHELYLKTIYNKVYDGSDCYSLGLNQDLFKIEVPFIKSANHNFQVEFECKEQLHSPFKKQKRIENELGPSGEPLSESEWIQQHFIILMNRAKSNGLFCLLNKSDQKNNKEAKSLSDKFYKNLPKEEQEVFSGGNDSDVAIVATHNNERYIFPPKSKFFCNDVLNLRSKMECLKKYDIILLDPPWWNKYIRRKKSKSLQSSYQMMYNKDLKDLHISSVTSPEAIVAVWCTNSPTHCSILKNEIFPAWGLKYLCKWYWVKVTQNGDPICPFSELPRKQPFEQIIFGYNETQSQNRILPENGKIIVSVPSAIHSHKPPLSELLTPYLPEKPKCLELFARYLLPSWTSWGNEVLKLQNILIYQNSANSSE